MLILMGKKLCLFYSWKSDLIELSLLDGQFVSVGFALLGFFKADQYFLMNSRYSHCAWVWVVAL